MAFDAKTFWLSHLSPEYIFLLFLSKDYLVNHHRLKNKMSFPVLGASATGSLQGGVSKHAKTNPSSKGRGFFKPFVLKHKNVNFQLNVPPSPFRLVLQRMKGLEGRRKA